MYDPNMKLGYFDHPSGDGRSLEVTVDIIDRNTGDSKGFTCDNLTHVMYFIVQNGLLPIEEYLYAKIEALIPGPDKELPGLEGTAVDGLTAQGLLDAYRANQGPLRVIIVCYGDPNLADTFVED